MTEMISGVTARMKHIRAANICSDGARKWFHLHGIPWQGFLDNGVPVEVLEATGDKMALDVAEIARADHGR